MKVTLTSDRGDDKAGDTVEVDDLIALHLLGNAKATRAEPPLTVRPEDIEGDPAQPPPDTDEDWTAPPDESNTVAEIRAYLADRPEIDNTGLTKKADFLAAIRGDKTRAPQPPADTGDNEGEPNGQQ